MNSNPLAKHFRQPAMYLKLPSQGKFYPAGSLDMPTSNELPVFPMTALDEITYRIPDALFNGNATVDVIKSCVPNIKDPWQMPNVDLDAILIGMRIASTGEKMDIGSQCPHCGHEAEFEVDLVTLLSRIQPADYETPVRVGDLEIYLQPLSYKRVHENQMIQFADQQRIQQLAEDNSQESINDLNKILKELNLLAMESVAESIRFIKDEDTVVDDRNFVLEYIRNAPKESFKLVRDKLTTIREKMEIPPFQITCENHECQKTFTAPFTMDTASFFGRDS